MPIFTKAHNSGYARLVVFVRNSAESEWLRYANTEIVEVIFLGKYSPQDMSIMN